MLSCPVNKKRAMSLYRKLMPTYDERLVWGIGDGHGLVAHKVQPKKEKSEPWTVTKLNCWENWVIKMISSFLTDFILLVIINEN